MFILIGVMNCLVAVFCTAAMWICWPDHKALFAVNLFLLAANIYMAMLNFGRARDAAHRVP